MTKTEKHVLLKLTSGPKEAPQLSRFKWFIGGIYVTLAHMEHAKLILRERIVDTEGRIRHRYSITEAGRAALLVEHIA